MTSESESKSNQQPIYKKWWFWTIIVIVLVIIYAVSPKQQESQSSEPDNQAVETPSTDTDTKTEITLEYSEGPMREIESTIRNRTAEKYEDAEITDLLIFDETDNGKDDYTVMVYLNWDKKNKSATAKEMLETYSSDLAATLANERPNVNAVNIYWRIPYLQENGKKVGNGENYWIYTKKSNGMVLKDENWIYE